MVISLIIRERLDEREYNGIEYRTIVRDRLMENSLCRGSATRLRCLITWISAGANNIFMARIVRDEKGGGIASWEKEL